MSADPELEALLKELIDSGVAPKYVVRLTAELQDHYADLEHEAQRHGIPADDAAADALERLGRCAAIAREFERHPELKSWVFTSVWLAALLRKVAGGWILLSAPVRAVAVGPDALMRYAAAAAAGSIVTVTLLLSMYLILSPRLGPSAWLPKAPPLSVLASREIGASEDVRLERAASAPAAAPQTVQPRHTFETSIHTAPTPAYSARRPRARYASGAIALAATPAPVAIATELKITSGFDADGELQPIIGTPLEYPAAAAARNLQGHVVIEYTVSRTGAVTDLVVVESSHDLFRRAALDAAGQFQYAPRIVGGEAVDVHGVRTTIRFLLEP